MKALKEKRISLRSLWRRGLVILSLFALVFASCNDSDEGGGGGTVVVPSPEPISFEIYKQPTKVSYEGCAVDLTGLVVLVKYKSGPLDMQFLTKDDISLYTDPPVAVGVIGEEPSREYWWIPMTKYTLMYQTSGRTFTDVLEIPSVIPVTRAKDWKIGSDPNNGFKYPDNWDQFWSQGLELTGPLTDNVYVDDYPDLAALKLQAEYADGSKLNVPLATDAVWEIKPSYDDGTKTDKAYPGDLWVAVGDNTLDATHPYVTDAIKKAKDPATGNKSSGFAASIHSPQGINPKLTASHKYLEVYHVKAIELTPGDPGFDPFFYWSDDTNTAWVDRLIAKDAGIKVTYINDVTKEFTVKKAVEMNAVWKNTLGTTIVPGVDLPFGVDGIGKTSGQAHDKNKTPKITINYRGAYTQLKVPVYTKFTGITVTAKDGGAITLDMHNLSQDNDKDGMNATAFSKLIEVKASFTAYSDATLAAAELPLNFVEKYCASAKITDTGTVASSVTAGVPTDPTKPEWKAEATAYSMNFGWLRGYTWPGTVNAKNNGKTQNVRVYYKPPTVGTINPGVKNNRVTVGFESLKSDIP